MGRAGSRANSDADVAETGGGGGVSGVADLARLTLASVGRSPGHGLRRQHVHRRPERGTDPRVRRVAQQTAELSFKCNVDYRGYITDIDLDRNNYAYGYRR